MKQNGTDYQGGLARALVDGSALGRLDGNLEASSTEIAIEGSLVAKMITTGVPSPISHLNYITLYSFFYGTNDDGQGVEINSSEMAFVSNEKGSILGTRSTYLKQSYV